MKNCNKIKQTCGTKNLSTCIDHETTLPSFTKLTGCVTLEETTTELYDLVGEIRTQIDLSALGEKCLTYVLDLTGKKGVKNILLKHEQEICDLKAKVKQLEERQICDIPITQCLTDFDCLVLSCSTTIITLKDWMQAVQTKICLATP